jgi:hypothetical protein
MVGVCFVAAGLLAPIPVIRWATAPDPVSAAPPEGASAFTPVNPTRLVDTRSGARLGAGTTTDFQITGGVVPATATAIVVNVTAVASLGGGWVQVFPTGKAAVGSSSTLNVDFTGQTIPNASFAPLGIGGKVSVHTTFATHLLIDVSGYFTPAASATAGRLVPVSPTRLLDTRSGIGWTPPSTTTTTTTTTKAPSATTTTTKPPSPPPGNPGDTKNCTDFATHAEAQAWFNTYVGAYGDVAHLDSDGDGIACESLPYMFGATNVPAATVISLQVAGRGGVPPTGASAVVLSVTAVDPSAEGWVQVAPTPIQIGASSTLNLTAGRTIANLAVVPLGSGGRVDVYSTVQADLLADVVGYFTDGTAADSTQGLFVPIVPDRRFDSRTLSPQPLAAGTISSVPTSGIAPGAIAIAGNVTASAAKGGGWVQLAPAPIAVGAASNLNTAYDDQTIANAAVSPVGVGGQVQLYTDLPAHLLLDITGWFTGAT